MQHVRRNLLIAIVLLLPAQLVGEGFTVQSIVDTQFQGAFGSIVGAAARMSGNSLRNVATTSYLQGHQLRTDSARSGTIYDLDAERIINIDHKQKTYSSMTFAEMSAAMERARASAEQSRAKDEAKAAKAGSATAEQKDKVNVKYHVTVDRPGQHEKIADYDAERLFITITLEAEVTPEGKKAEQAGNMVFLMDQWISKAAPQVPAYAEFYRLFSQKLGREFRSQVQGLQAVFAADPRMKDGFEAAAKEMQKMKGISLRSAIYVTIVPANMTFDRQLALDEFGASELASAKSAEAAKGEKPKSGFGGFLSGLKTAAEDVSKQLDKANQKTDAPPKQTNLLVTGDMMQSISSGAVPAAMFLPPAGYREVSPKGGS